jgi:23S rRNA (pseudouridine1915-N3)-methyltransferase
LHIRLIAIGDRQPGWVDEAFAEYVQRLPRQWKFRLQAMAGGRRSKHQDSASVIEADGRKLLAEIGAGEYVIALDEHGKQFTSTGLGEKLSDWQNAARDLTFLIGGPDGLAEACLLRADLCWSLSKLTLPHGFARVLFAEQLYRAWTVNTGHPYHRV